MVSTKTVTIKSTGDLNSSAVGVVAVFEPTGAYSKYDPIVWRLTSLPSAETFQPDVYSSIPASTWTDDLAFSALDDTSDLPAAQYILTSQQTSLQGNSNTGFSFTAPQTAHTQPSPKCFNLTGTNANIGFGFIVGRGGMQEEMDPVAAFTNVLNQKSVDAKGWAPYLNVYIVPGDQLPVAEGQRITKGMLSSGYLCWSRDLRTLSAASVTLNVSYDPTLSRYVIHDGTGYSQAFMDASRLLKWPAQGRTLDATIYFPFSASDGLTHISEELGSRGYVVDILKCGDDVLYGKVSLQVPRNLSCDQAKCDLESVTNGVVTSFAGKLLFLVSGTFHAYVDINPTTFAWFDNRIDPLPSAFAEEGATGDVAAMEGKVDEATQAIGKVALSARNGNAPAVNGNDVGAPKRQATLTSRMSAQEISAQ
ncbi:uncharacterized protein BXZ73DRAFT_75899 [Epithele typhae]|uniref:uncharacterized protein n=1 Tax=Epithele typhae TaxID=378194 RepID=UPI002008EAA0|nr:uncharacterized protein BXZ73DRAFT_75899 [Epithele typhae]KAH9939723.1 hypothetical protein BXZ73DRAFT_75899 [Epithele typhae]